MKACQYCDLAAQMRPRVFSIEYVWKHKGQLFTDHTAFDFAGTARDALASFTRKFPHVTSCRVLGEVAR